jgi:hypothetical protein
VHVGEHRHPDLLLDPARILSPSAVPGPRKLSMDERFALSNELLKMNGMPSAAVISFRRAGDVENQASLR